MDIAATPSVSDSALADHPAIAIESVRDPRGEMAMRLPAWLQPFLTWLTAKPAPGERKTTTPRYLTLVDAAARMAVGVLISSIALQTEGAPLVLLGITGTIITTSGMGIVQVIIFHYCAHGQIFSKSSLNTIIGRAISIIFIFKYFDDYKSEHLQHHRAQKLLTDEDEFATFVVNICRLAPGDCKRRLWHRVIVSLFSPAFHIRFLAIRIRGSFLPGSLYRTAMCFALWGGLAGGAFYLDVLNEFLLAWVLPLTLPLQAATVLRILCEHRFPNQDVLSTRGKLLICHSTTGVFPGRSPPSEPAGSFRGGVKWALWWIDLVTVHIFSRIFVLVGDAPCHDFHHRRPGSGDWPVAVYSRQQDKEDGCPGYPVNYIDVWGLFPAIDGNLEALSRAERCAL